MTAPPGVRISVDMTADSDKTDHRFRRKVACDSDDVGQGAGPGLRAGEMRAVCCGLVKSGVLRSARFA
jgi:hypothetical protein